MKSKKAILIMWILSLLPFGMVALCWRYLPDRVPIHWGFDGQVDGWASPEKLWLLCAVGPAMSLLLQFLPRLDPKKENYEKFQSYYDMLGAVTPLILLVCVGITLSESLWPGRLDVSRVIGVAIGVLFIVVGNLMGKVKTNWFMGFRTPWAISDPDVWNKTQRMGGWTLFLSGAAAVVLSLLAPERVFFVAFLGILLVGIGGTYFMSWKWFREKEGDR